MVFEFRLLLSRPNSDLSHNRLESIEGLSNLVELRILDISNNEIAALEGLSGCLALETLLVASNRLSGVTSLRVGMQHSGVNQGGQRGTFTRAVFYSRSKDPRMPSMRFPFSLSAPDPVPLPGRARPGPQRHPRARGDFTSACGDARAADAHDARQPAVECIRPQE